ncbi:MAG: hypothetical protein R2744_10560 [Bacteroidales bacterium]
MISQIVRDKCKPVAAWIRQVPRQTFGNKDFLVNCLNWLVDDNGIIEPQVKGGQIKTSRLAPDKWMRGFSGSCFNSAGPIILVVIASLITAIFRRRKYGLH